MDKLQVRLCEVEEPAKTRDPLLPEKQGKHSCKEKS